MCCPSHTEKYDWFHASCMHDASPKNGMMGSTLHACLMLLRNSQVRIGSKTFQFFKIHTYAFVCKSRCSSSSRFTSTHCLMLLQNSLVRIGSKTFQFFKIHSRFTSTHYRFVKRAESSTQKQCSESSAEIVTARETLSAAKFRSRLETPSRWVIVKLLVISGLVNRALHVAWFNLGHPSCFHSVNLPISW
jgi:hypothetical protein